MEKPEQYQIGIDTFERSAMCQSPEVRVEIAKFNIDKYCWRNKGQDISDFKKIKDYCDFAIEALGELDDTKISDEFDGSEHHVYHANWKEEDVASRENRTIICKLSSKAEEKTVRVVTGVSEVDDIKFYIDNKMYLHTNINVVERKILNLGGLNEN